MKIATAGLLLAALIVTSACSNKAATSTDAAASATAQASPRDTPATDTDIAASPAPSASSYTVTTKDGTATVGGSIDPAKLGAPVYPGAQPDNDAQSGISAETPQGSTYLGMFKTTDGFDKVYDYYKSQMPSGSEAMKLSMGNTSSATWQVGKDGSADEVLVQVNSDKDGKVTILITHVIKTNVSPSPA